MKTTLGFPDIIVCKADDAQEFTLFCSCFPLLRVELSKMHTKQ